MNKNTQKLKRIVPVRGQSKIWKLADEERELPTHWPEVNADCLAVWQPGRQLLGWVLSRIGWVQGGFWGTDNNWYLIPLTDPRNRPGLDHFGIPATLPTPEPEPAENPPLGIMPERDWIQRRVSEICHAILRYNEAGKPAKPAWLDELGRHNGRLSEIAEGGAE